MDAGKNKVVNVRLIYRGSGEALLCHVLHHRQDLSRIHASLLVCLFEDSTIKYFFFFYVSGLK